MASGRPTIAASLARFLFATVLLSSTWWIGCEALRERAPMYLGVYLVVFYLPLAMACTARIPRHGLVFAILVPLLVGIDIGVDAWIPYEPRFVFPAWELLRCAALVVAGAGVSSVKDPTPRMRQVFWTAEILGVLLVGAVSACAFHIVLDGPHDETHHADGALVLGFALDDRGQPQPSMIARVDHAVDLYRRGLASWLVMSGGVVHGEVAEAVVMRSLAEARGVPATAIYTEEHSHDTEENFAYSAALLDSLRAHDVLLVTEPYHMTRALFLGMRFGLDLRPSPAPSPVWSNPRTATYWVFRDSIALFVEYVRGPLMKAQTAAR